MIFRYNVGLLLMMYSTLSVPLRGRYYDPCFIGDKAEAQRSRVNIWDLNPSLFEFKAKVSFTFPLPLFAFYS